MTELRFVYLLQPGEHYLFTLYSNNLGRLFLCSQSEDKAQTSRNLRPEPRPGGLRFCRGSTHGDNRLKVAGFGGSDGEGGVNDSNQSE